MTFKILTLVRWALFVLIFIFIILHSFKYKNWKIALAVAVGVLAMTALNFTLIFFSTTPLLYCCFGVGWLIVAVIWFTAAWLGKKAADRNRTADKKE